jgi:hypothetical protein
MIHIFYRHYDVGGSVSRQDSTHMSRSDGRFRTPWFDYEKCFSNLLRTTEGLSVKVNVVMDGGLRDNWIGKYKDRFQLHEIAAGSDFPSFFKTVEIAKNDPSISPTDIVYLLENDYIHADGWVKKVEDLFENYSDRLSYVSLYDHLDKYVYPMYANLMSRLFISKSHHWRTTPSTCGTFMIRKDKFDQDYDVLSTWKEDHNKFLWLTQNRGRSVITPVPGLSTHCVTELSPNVDWEKYNY